MAVPDFKSPRLASLHFYYFALRLHLLSQHHDCLDCVFNLLYPVEASECSSLNDMSFTIQPEENHYQITYWFSSEKLKAKLEQKL